MMDRWLFRLGGLAVAMGVAGASVDLLGQEVGRYQLLTASLESQAGVLQTRVFKLDTATGHSWVYVFGGETGRPAGQWLAIQAPEPEAPPPSTTAIRPAVGQNDGSGAKAIPRASRVPGENIVAAPLAKPTAEAPGLALKDGGESEGPASAPKDSGQTIGKAGSGGLGLDETLTLPKATVVDRSPLRPNSVVGVRQQLAQYNRTIAWAKAHPKGEWVDDGKGGRRFVTPEEIEVLLKDTEERKKRLVEDLKQGGFQPYHFKQ